jgi:hypothetical protein
MYCVKCGVELRESETKCPLCKTAVYHPDIPVDPAAAEAAAVFPPSTPQPHAKVSHKGILFILTFCFAIPVIILFLCDYNFNGGITWSGYAVGALIFCYAVIVLPIWFHRPNPVIFVPTSFAAAALYLLYISEATGGGWFMSFAFWVVLWAAAASTAIVALVRYVRRGYLFIAGGALISAGGYCVLIEYLVNRAFGVGDILTWSLYPLTAGVLLGIMLIVIALVPVLRESLHKRFFI